MAELIPKSKDLYFVNGINDPGKFGTKTPTGNSRLYNCKQCDRAFTRYEHLSRHIMLTHNKLKPFACGICSRAFSRRDLLLRHAKNLHQGSELAVPRIRKQLKTLECEERIVDFKLEEERLEDDRLDLEKLEDDVVLPLPQTKRLKLSVDMLVS
ncbi:hypothetical protein METBIDRAFT_33390 [Metschnikowia bicuspidata var. bicuspidata NRRL YB-4993]|uniref:C2H2-type domain-containing protein n=1 Tax=Metschnikowia bicuspidata var. bicuspidata NRRL YB-4993 TaxID=869754 RepID=A0A1A0H528_9ASCO|nr:hypothetical protein METBIDRAFT_33390 [Metschnikowia bicuspidata var. bicuspidata NRRL YB-4993]OBA19179.1 hypothetical protein METBIDRAFT_33390 [Metschnikowia bicuspidata var. bicuspidata NRRL YB-4993]